MEYLSKALQSKTVWTIIIIFILGGLQAISEFMNPTLFMALNSGLLALAAHFRINTKANIE